ncbi:MAG: glycosyltransferase family 2 protein [Pseudomonadota bacterium]
MRSVIIIPALNEEAVIGSVVGSVRDQVDQVIVVNNGSTDRTAERAITTGAEVIDVPQPGYGRACLAGVSAAHDADLIVFMDGDGADDPEDLRSLIDPIINGTADFVVGSRLLGQTERGALTFAQRFGNRLATALMRVIWGGQFTDLGPFRAITRSAYDTLNMQAETYGWTIEMQVRALKHELRYTEIPVTYRRRIGVSKISGTLKGVCLAGWFILGTIFKEALFTPAPRRCAKPPHADPRALPTGSPYRQ